MFLLFDLAVWQADFYLEVHRGRLYLYVFDVGQGDALFIAAPNGNQVLIDGGPDNSVVSRLAQVMPFWDRSLDLVILTHPHADHISGLIEVLKRYDVGAVLESGVNHSIPEYAEWHKILEENKIKVALASAGEEIKLGAGAELQVLTPKKSFVGASPKNIHEAMVVLELRYGSSVALLMGDAEVKLERELVSLPSNKLAAQILKIGHHGSKTSTSEIFLKAVNPRWAVISVGRRNRYGHPVQEVLDRMVGLGIKIYRTDQDGDIVFVSDGSNFSLKR